MTAGLLTPGANRFQLMSLLNRSEFNIFLELNRRAAKDQTEILLVANHERLSDAAGLTIKSTTNALDSLHHKGLIARDPLRKRGRPELIRLIVNLELKLRDSERY